MQDKHTLIELGFSRFPDWDFVTTETEHYRLIVDGVTFRAFVEENNGPAYVQIGVAVNNYGHTEWFDCSSNGSVSRFINTRLEAITT